MRHLLVALLTGGLLAGPVTAEAANVVVVGKEWRQLTETVGFTWSQVYSVCGTGYCAGGTGALSTLNGWNWADNTELQVLFEEVLYPGTTQFSGPTSGYSLGVSNDPGIAAAFNLFDQTASFPTGRYFRGWSRSYYSSFGYQPWFQDYFTGTGDNAGLNPSAPFSFSDSDLGVWLYREVAPVPLPAAAWLLLSGLGGLGFMGRRRKAA